MNRYIQRASQPNSTDAHVLGNSDGKLPTYPLLLLRNRHSYDGDDGDVDTALYFSVLIDETCSDPKSSSQNTAMSKSAIVGLLALPALQFQSMSSSMSLEEVKMDNSNRPNEENKAWEDSKAYQQEKQQRQYQEEEVEISRLYLNAVALHIDSLIHVWNNAITTTNTSAIATESTHNNSGIGMSLNFSSRLLVLEIIKAVTCAAHVCKNRRSSISSSGIISAFITFLTSIQNPSSMMMVSLVQQESSPNTEDAHHPGGFLTPFHPEFLQCCILAGQYRMALKYVQEYPVRSISSFRDLSIVSSLSYSYTSNINVASEIYLRYHYYLGMIYLGCDLYREAHAAFSICVTMPSEKISSIVIAARKKMLLLNCLQMGEEEEEVEFEEEQEQESSTPLNSTKMSKTVRSLFTTPKGTSSIVSLFFDRVSNIMTSHMNNSLSRSTSISSGGGLSRSNSINTTSLNNPLSQGLYPEEPKGTVKNPEDDVPIRVPERGPILDRIVEESRLIYYEEIVRAFGSNDIPKMKVLIQSHAIFLSVDGNYGLCLRLIPVMQYLVLRRMGRVYQVMQIKNLGQSLYLDDESDEIHAVETWLMKLALKRQFSRTADSLAKKPTINFRLDMEKGIIIFLPNYDNRTTQNGGNRTNATISDRMNSYVSLAERVSQLDVSIATSFKYHSALLKEEISAKQSASDTGRSVSDLF